jgi:hypothetical protein
MSLDRCLINRERVHRFVVKRDAGGWEVSEEEDSAVLRRVHRKDWHRVERDVRLFEISALALKREGWIEN